MGCNCKGGKNKGMSPSEAVRKAQAAKAARQAANSPKMAAPKGKTQSFALRLRDGRTFTFGSKLEAEAENVRQGYTGTIRPA